MGGVEPPNVQTALFTILKRCASRDYPISTLSFRKSPWNELANYSRLELHHGTVSLRT